MTRRIPVLPTLIVLIAAATMIALGFWQLGRAHERDRMHRQVVERLRLPVAPYPYRNPGDAAFLYRRVSATCAAVEGWETRAGRSAAGRTGWRQIATCRGPGGGATFLVDMGIASAPTDRASWRGGAVTGRAIRGPDHRRPLERLLGRKKEQPLMIVSESAAPGLAPSQQPDPSDDANSSWSYTVQWFLFAATALVIYVLALRKRWRG